MAHDSSDPAQLALHLDRIRLTQIQPTATPQGWAALPAETIYHILRFLDPQDLIRLQTVSKLFHAIVGDPALWRTAYSTIPLPLPPGPFPWQSKRFLQRTLVQSARLAHTWTTEPLTFVSRKLYPGSRVTEEDRLKWVCGRWLITSKEMKQLVSRDVETGLEQVLWDQGTFGFWSAASVMNPLAHFIYLAVHLEQGRLSDPVKLLEFVVNDDTGCLSGSEILDVPTWALQREGFIPQIRVDSGLAPRFYRFPRFRTQLDLLLNYRGAWLPHLVEVYFTETHLFVLNRSYLIHGFIGNVEVIQIFAFPDIDPDPDGPTSDGIPASNNKKSAVHELRLTHEVLSRDTASLWLFPIRNAVFDPVTQTTTLRFMHVYAPFQPDPETRVRLVCTDYILPAARPGSTRTITADGNGDVDENRMGTNGHLQRSLGAIFRSTEPVLPITVASHDVFSVQGVWNDNLVDASDDGFVRGVCVISRYGERSTPDVGMVHKFSVDATGPRCVAVVGDPSPPWVGFEATRTYEYDFDGVRGKLWSTKGDLLERDSGGGRPADRDTLAVLIDFK